MNAGDTPERASNEDMLLNGMRGDRRMGDDVKVGVKVGMEKLNKVGKGAGEPALEPKRLRSPDKTVGPCGT